MTTSVDKQNLQNGSQRFSRPQIATLVLLGVVAISGAIVAAWFAGQGTISGIFSQLNQLQSSPPLWLEVPIVAGEYLLFPTVVLFLIVMIVMKVSPQPRSWSRFVVVGILLALTFRYLLWRTLSTLNLSTPLDGFFSLGLFFLEIVTIISAVLELLLMLRVRDRKREADWLAMDVAEGRFTPSVDIMIPTYNEPSFILRRTIMGCQAMDYPYKRVYLLDDTHRLEARKIAEELGCEYIARTENHHAKAGNLNHALMQTTGDLIVSFDADFVPTKNFLSRTVGFFQDPQVALVQTPQSFYNCDPLARNLGMEDLPNPGQEIFHHVTQTFLDGAGGLVCSGTSFIVRRNALEETGGFVTDSLSEDYFTGVRLSAQGYRLIYLNEKLSAGLAPENTSAHAVQQLRWSRGTLQAFFIKTNPLTVSGLNLMQRFAHLHVILSWFGNISRAGFLIIPLAYSFLNVIPIRSTTTELLYFFVPYYLIRMSAYSWLNHRSGSALLSDVYSVVMAFPLAVTIIQVMLNPFSKGFRVTPKGNSNDRYFFNWNLAWPLLGVFILTAISLWVNFGMCMLKGAWMTTVPPEVAIQAKGIGLGWIWSSYNLVILGIALLVLLDAPQPSPYEWFNLRRTVSLQVVGQSEHQGFWGFTTMISEIGAEIALTQAGFPSMSEQEPIPVQLEILEYGLHLSGQAIQTSTVGEFPAIRVMFDPLRVSQQRSLVEMLFCRPGQWKDRHTPGEIQSFFLLFKALLRPRVLFDRNVDVNAVSVSQV